MGLLVMKGWAYEGMGLDMQGVTFRDDGMALDMQAWGFWWLMDQLSSNMQACGFWQSTLLLPPSIVKSSGRRPLVTVAFAIHLPRMARDDAVLCRDRARTAAISRYVADHRDMLLKDIPDDRLKANKETKRRELVRLGRQRFRMEPESVQQKYLRVCAADRRPASSVSPGDQDDQVVAAAPAGSAPSGGQVVKAVPASSASSGGQVVAVAPAVVVAAPASVPGPSPKRARVARSLSPPAELELVATTAAATSASQPTTDQPRHAGELRQTLSKQIPWLWKRFGSADGAQILSTSYRWIHFVIGLHPRPPCHMAAAAVLGLAAKFHGQDGGADVRQIWSRTAGQSNRMEVEVLEHRIFEAWAVDNLPGDFASERQRALTLSGDVQVVKS